MSKNKILQRAFVDAFGVVAYVGLFAWFVNNLHLWFGSAPSGWLGSVFFLMMFIISASITGSLVLMKPILLFLEGHKKEAVHLFLYTLGFLVLMALIVFSCLIGGANYANPGK